MSTLGLHRITSDELKRLLRAVHRGAISSPITRSSLIEKSFGHVEEHLDALVGRDHETAKAVIAAVLAERGAHANASVKLSYMGVAAPGTRSRDLLDQTRELMSGASSSVELYGLPLAPDRGVLRTLGALLEGRELSARLVFDGAGAQAGAELRTLVKQHLRKLERVELFVSSTQRVRMRALVVDAARILVTSGDLAATEDDQTLDLGALLEDPAYIAAWHHEWSRLVDSGTVERVSLR